MKEDNEYFLIPESREVNISAEIRKKDGQTFWTPISSFHARHLPKQETMLGTKTSGVISKQQLSYSTQINVGSGFEIPDYYTRSSKILIIGPQVLFFDSLYGSSLENNERRQLQRLNGG